MQAAREGTGRGSIADVARHYLGDLVYGANDGIITTFAVAAGVAGASLHARIVLILGVANLVADGFSMAASNYLAIRSRGALANVDGGTVESDPLRHALATFVAFGVAGAIPLLAYLLPIESADRFTMAAGLTLCALFVVGAARSLVTSAGYLLSGFEMLAVGASAAAVSYGIGKLLAHVA